MREKRKYPSWAPQDVLPFHELDCEEASNEDCSPQEKERAEIGQKLLSNLIMKEVWEKLESYDRLMFWHNVLASLPAHKSAWEQLTASSRKEKERDINKAISDLIRLLKTYFTRKTALSLFDKKEVMALELALRREPWVSDYQAALMRDIDPGMEGVKLKSRHHPNPNLELLSPLKITPTLFELLERLANDIRDNPPSERCIVKQPSSANSDMHYFIRNLAQKNRDEFECPMVEVIASTASVIFDVDIANNTVSRLLNRGTKPKEDP